MFPGNRAFLEAHREVIRKLSKAVTRVISKDNLAAKENSTCKQVELSGGDGGDRTRVRWRFGGHLRA